MYASMKRTALLLACVGMIVPQGTVAAAENTQKQQTVRMLDVKLAKGGTLAGQVVDAQGRSVSGTTVSIRFANRVVAQTKTDAQGRYTIHGLRSGVHHLQTPSGLVPARFWDADSAPPAARTNALIVSDKNVIRAQCGGQNCQGNCCNTCCDDNGHGMLMAGLVIAGVATAIAIAADDDDDDNGTASP